MARPPKDPADRRTNSMHIPMTDAEKAAVVEYAESIGAKPVTWARELMLKAARKKRTASGERGSRTRTG